MNALLILLALTQLNVGVSHAEPDLGDDEAMEEQVEVDELEPVRIREIRKYLSTVDASTTCLDEYLNRRQQLIVKLALTPVTMPLTVASSVMGFGYLGSVIGSINNPPGGWGDLAGLAAGMVYGGLGSVIYSGINTGVAGVRLHRLNLMLKALGEQYLGRPAEKTDALYGFYLKRSEGSVLSKEQFISKLMENDRLGSLCDGSMIKKKRIRIGSKLKFKVANAKDFALYLNRQE